MTNVRTYLDVVPESAKEQISKEWGDRKAETFKSAQMHEITIDQGTSFNKVVAFSLEKGYYHLISDIVSVEDVAVQKDIQAKVSSLINKMVDIEEKNGCVPLLASNICDWDSSYAKQVGANIRLRDSIIDACLAKKIILTGGETANLGEQLGKTKMAWMFTLLSRYTGRLSEGPTQYKGLDADLMETFESISDSKNFRIVYAKGMPLLEVKKKSMFMITADGSGSKSIVCELVGSRTDIKDTLASAGDDPTREGAFPIIASIGIHSESPAGKKQLIEYMNKAGKECRIPLVGSVFHEDKGVYTYTMNGTVLSEVKSSAKYIGKEIKAGLSLVLLYEEQRTNGITLQRKVFEDAFGEKWYNLKVADALSAVKKEAEGTHPHVTFSDTNKTLGELVAQPSTPYFTIDSMMPEALLNKIRLRINVSSGGLVGKTRRALEPLGLGADYFAPFGFPELILLLEMSSRLKNSKGSITDEVSYYTWGCGNGSVIGTTDPMLLIKYYESKGIHAKLGGEIIKERR